jgi:uncharacterized protein (DUF1800 family)
MSRITSIVVNVRFFVALLAGVGAPAQAAPNAILGYDDARHLLARTGFGPTDLEIRTYAPLTRNEAVAKLLRETITTAVTPPPASAVDTSPLRPPRGENVPEAERKAFQQQQIREGLDLRAWWVHEMLATPSPLTERMTLFWHNHFVSAQQKVRFARLMYRQNVTLRYYALGNFGAFLHAIAKDPAMILYLDSAQNRKGAPNENFAREVMELFTLGEGRYSEQDVKEAARAFTGWSLDRETGTFVFRPRLRDDGMKVVLTRSGRLDGDAVLDILLARPETAEFVTAKLWREFVSPDPDPVEVKRIARLFRDSNYDIKVALREMLSGDTFYAQENRGVLVKSPVELVVGTLRQLDLAPGTALPFAIAAAGMGQNLMSPPNVKGWPGGETWINTTTLLARKQYLDRVIRAGDGASPAPVSTPGGEPMDTERSAPKRALAPLGVPDDDKARQQRFVRQMERGLASLDFDSMHWIAQFPGATPAERGRAAQRLLLATVPQQRADPDADSRTLVHAIVLDAAYQLK